MNTNAMELNLNEMEMINGGWNWKECIFWGTVGTVAGAGVGAHVGGVPGAVIGGVVGGAIGAAAGWED